jgi:hypothetical protein
MEPVGEKAEMCGTGGVKRLKCMEPVGEKAEMYGTGRGKG